jgi:hypothetical protein
VRLSESFPTVWNTHHHLGWSSNVHSFLFLNCSLFPYSLSMSLYLFLFFFWVIISMCKPTNGQVLLCFSSTSSSNSTPKSTSSSTLHQSSCLQQQRRERESEWECWNKEQLKRRMSGCWNYKPLVGTVNEATGRHHWIDSLEMICLSWWWFDCL